MRATKETFLEETEHPSILTSTSRDHSRLQQQKPPRPSTDLLPVDEEVEVEAAVVERRCSPVVFVTDHSDTNMFFKTMREHTQERSHLNAKNVIKDSLEIIT